MYQKKKVEKLVTRGCKVHPGRKTAYTSGSASAIPMGACKRCKQRIVKGRKPSTRSKK